MHDALYFFRIYWNDRGNNGKFFYLLEINLNNLLRAGMCQYKGYKTKKVQVPPGRNFY